MSQACQPLDTAALRALWLQIARDGGWWSARSLRAHWTPTFTEFELEQLLRALLLSRCVARREVVSGTQSYSVTSECVPFPGFALDGTPTPPIPHPIQGVHPNDVPY